MTRSPQQQQELANALRQFWQTTGETFALAKAGQEKRAQQLAATVLPAQQSALASLVARLLFKNNEAEEQAAARVAVIYNRVGRNIYAFLAAMLVGIIVTSLYLIDSTKRLFAEVESLSQQRRVLAAKLITVQEEVLRSVSRELHDEFGQILTAVGAILGRAEAKGLAAGFAVTRRTH